MNIVVNGETVAGVSEGLSVRAFLENRASSLMETMLIEHNQCVLLKHEWDATELKDGDRLELLTIVAGG